MILAIVEAIALFAAVTGTLFVWRPLVVADWFDVAAFLAPAAAVSICCVVAFYYNDLYDFRVVRSFSGFVTRLLQSFGVALILLAGLYAVMPDTRITQSALLSSGLVIVGLLLPIRALGYALVRHRSFADRVLILGTGEMAHALIEEIDARPYLGYQIVGVVGDHSGSDMPRFKYPLLGSCADLSKIVQDTRVDRIIVAMTERRGRMPMRQLLEAEARRVTIEEGLDTYEYFTTKIAIENLRPSLLIFSKSFKKTRLQLGLRRLVSLVVAVLALILMAPLMAILALAIKLDSKGPVLFRQARVGPRGRHFKLLKFRTMVPAELPRSEWVHDNQDRITRVGRWLRKYRLDELPQFFNVLRGDMNLVGPRPHPVSNFELFSEQIPYYVLRTSVRPGVTGWAQIRYGYANNLEEEIEKMRYDLYYIKHLSFWFDLRILFDTVKILLFGQGSEAADAYPHDKTVAGTGGKASRPLDLPAVQDLVGAGRPRDH